MEKTLNLMINLVGPVYKINTQNEEGYLSVLQDRGRLGSWRASQG